MKKSIRQSVGLTESQLSAILDIFGLTSYLFLMFYPHILIYRTVWGGGQSYPGTFGKRGNFGHFEMAPETNFVDIFKVKAVNCFQSTVKWIQKTPLGVLKLPPVKMKYISCYIWLTGKYGVLA